MNSLIDKIITFGVSVRGPNHVRAQEKNQDAWLGSKTRSFAMIVVCDGLGSRPQSGMGARVACQAVNEAIRIWNKTPNASVSNLPKLIKLIWEMRLTGLNQVDFATTCIFACVTSSGRLIVAGLGDGIALIRSKDGSVNQVIGRETGFSNQTIALGSPHQLSDWKTFEIEQLTEGTTLLLATDGIADDLLPEKYSHFVEWLESDFSYMDPIKRKKKLRRALLDWPTPLHQDDKTLTVISLPVNKVEEDKNG